MAQSLTSILSGSLSSRSGGFLLRMPDGAYGREFLGAAIREAYGNLGHPDLRILDPEGEVISVDDVRELRDFLSTSPLGGGMKTLLVIGADRMNTASANAFLKSLEEPTRHTRIILATDRPWTLPATVLSRCHKLTEPMSEDALVDEARSRLEKDVSDSEISEALELCRSNPAAAADVIQYDLGSWISGVLEWLANPTGPCPKAPGSGKSPPRLETLFRLLQSNLMDCASGAMSISGWSQRRAELALSTLNTMAKGIQRPGIDWKTRLTATLICLAYDTGEAT